MQACLECSKEFEWQGGLKNYCCKQCYMKNYYRNNREKLVRSAVFRSMVAYRRKKGLSLDEPRLKRAKGSGHINSDGYMRITKKGHPNAHKTGLILEHVFVMSEHLGRPLRKGETIHHKNGVRDDNRIENLELWSSSHPPGQRIEDKVKWAQEILQTYGT